MSSILIQDLSHNHELDRRAMSDLHGGTGTPSLGGLGQFANVNVTVNQNIDQLQNVQVNALNNVGFIGAGLGQLRFNVSPTQSAATNAFI
jgi:hypothetical protein